MNGYDGFSGVLLIFLFLVCACGDDGDPGNKSPVDDDRSGGGIVEGEPRDVTGRFLFGAEGTSGSGYQVWLLDHTAGVFWRETLDKDGQFVVPLSSFVEARTYTLHLIDSNLVEVGAVDFSEDLDGVQSVFTYNGGDGFDLGQIELTMTNHGTVDISSSIHGNMGGGFSMRTDLEIGLDTLPLPHGIEGIGAGSDLSLGDPVLLLYSFYNRASFPDLYAADLADHYRIRVEAESIKDDGLKNVFLSGAGPWLNGSRLVVAAEGGTIPWSLSEYSVPKLSSKRWEAIAYTGRVATAGELILLTLQPEKGALITLPLQVDYVFSLPPLITSVSMTGDDPTPVDYSSATALNGLTRPFCPQGDVVADVALPKDGLGDVMSVMDMPILDFQISYYRENLEALEILEPGPGDFPSPYRETFEEAVGDVKRTWTPTTALLRFDLSEATDVEDELRITLPQEVFLTKVGDDDVSKIRMWIYSRDEDGLNQAGVVAWFDPNCGSP